VGDADGAAEADGVGAVLPAQDIRLSAITAANIIVSSFFIFLLLLLMICHSMPK
jgi:hypothetical protein